MSFSSDKAFLSGPPQPLVAVRPQPNADAFELHCRLGQAERSSFLLESANGTNTTARYSFFGRDPYLTLTSRAQEYQIKTGEQIRHYQGSGLQALQHTLDESLIAKPEGLPPFYGGAVGYLSYDLVRSFESLPSLAADDLHLPELHMAFFDVIAAVDHHTRQLYLMYCPPLSRFQAEPREKLYREGCDRLAELEARLASPVAPLTCSHWPTQANFVPSQSREAYKTRVRRCQDYIAAGDIYQANLSHRFTLDLHAAASATGYEGYSTELYRRLRRINPAPFAGLVRFPDPLGM